jgi:hypothetical protein
MNQLIEISPGARGILAVLQDSYEVAITTAEAAKQKVAALRRSLREVPAQDTASDPRIEDMRLAEARRVDAQGLAYHYGNLLQRCNGWLDQLPAGSVLVDVKLPAAKGSLDKARQQIDALRGERSKVERSILPIEERTRLVELWVSENAQRVIPKLYYPEGGSKGAAIRLEKHDGTLSNEVVPLLCWLQPTQMVAQLMQSDAHKQIASDAVVLSHAERADRLNTINAELQELELQEQALVDKTGADQRRDVNPAALLRVQVTRAPKAARKAEADIVALNRMAAQQAQIAV